MPSIQTISVLPDSAYSNIANKNPNVNIRKFELPPRVVDTLSAKVEFQKQLLKDENGSDRCKQGESYPYTGYCSAKARLRNKRKVASVPPPPTYSGFNTMHSVPSDIKPPNDPLQWKTNVDVGMAAQKTTVASNKPPTSRYTQVSNVKRDTQDRVRKVHQMPSLDVNAGHRRADSVKRPFCIITTSSWRTGKELSDKILRDGRNKNQDCLHSTLSSPPSSIQFPSESSHDLTHPCGIQADKTQVCSNKVTGNIRPISKDVSRRVCNDILLDLELSSNDDDDEKDAKLKGKALKRSSSKFIGAENGKIMIFNGNEYSNVTCKFTKLKFNGSDSYVCT